MALKTVEANINVLEAAKQRITNAFETDAEIIISISGGKDSICMVGICYNLLQEGIGNPDKITVQFVDEEAMFDDVIDIVKDWRIKFMSIGCKFEWYCVEVKHYNCLNTLTEEETFITWDRYKEDVWVREKPKFEIIEDDPNLIPRKDNYQSFLTRKNRGKIILQGIRVSESVQRRKNIGKIMGNVKNSGRGGLTNDGFFYPIYDWTDDDIWRYIWENNLDFPETYLNLYRIGYTKRRMRISQFFSIDTASGLVDLNQFNPGLLEKIEAREPNAYLATLYWDTEMFRRIGGAEKKARKNEDWRKKTLELIADKEKFSTPEKQRVRRKFANLIARHGMIMDDKVWGNIYEALVGGDPKDRAYRAITVVLFSRYSNKN